MKGMGPPQMRRPHCIAMVYGVPYKGSKNAIAEWIVSLLPRGGRFVDLFAGGCSVSHAALLSGKYDCVLANDIGGGPTLFLDAINGRFDIAPAWVSRDEFFIGKDDDPYIKYCWSFGNDGKSYMYGKHIEPYKRAVYEFISNNSDTARYEAYHRAERLRKELCASGVFTDRTALSEAFERVMRLRSIRTSLQHYGERLDISRMDYRNVKLLKDDVVYCDIPYRNTAEHYDKMNDVGVFDYDEFYRWASEQDAKVFVSEYDMPEDAFVVIGVHERCGHLSATNNSNRKQEKVFIPRTPMKG